MTLGKSDVRELAVEMAITGHATARSCCPEGRPSPQPPFGTVANPIGKMMAELYNDVELLKQMRFVSPGSTLPGGAEHPVPRSRGTGAERR